MQPAPLPVIVDLYSIRYQRSSNAAYRHRRHRRCRRRHRPYHSRSKHYQSQPPAVASSTIVRRERLDVAAGRTRLTGVRNFCPLRPKVYVRTPWPSSARVLVTVPQAASADAAARRPRLATSRPSERRRRRRIRAPPASGHPRAPPRRLAFHVSPSTTVRRHHRRRRRRRHHHPLRTLSLAVGMDAKMPKSRYCTWRPGAVPRTRDNPLRSVDSCAPLLVVDPNTGAARSSKGGLPIETRARILRSISRDPKANRLDPPGNFFFAPYPKMKKIRTIPFGSRQWR